MNKPIAFLLLSLALIGVWVLTVITGSLLQVLAYLLSSNHPGLKKNLRRGIYLLLGALLLGYALYWKGQPPSASASSCSWYVACRRLQLSSSLSATRAASASRMTSATCGTVLSSYLEKTPTL